MKNLANSPVGAQKAAADFPKGLVNLPGGSALPGRLRKAGLVLLLIAAACSRSEETLEPAENDVAAATEASARKGKGGTSTDRLRLPVPQIAVVAQLPRFGEGVVFDREGRLYVSDPFDNAILRIAASGESSVWARVNMPNGHKVRPDGTHIVLEQGESGGAVAFLDASGRVLRRITADEQGRPLRFPNDVTLDGANGGFYFTDPGPFMGGQPGRIFYVNAQGEIRTVSEGQVDFPNGIVLRPDGQSLLVAESLQNRVLAFRVVGPGRLSAPRPFADLPSQPNPWTNGEAEPDGMALDRAGNLYVAHFGAGVVRVFDPQGRLLGTLGSGASSITNLAFGGAAMNELYLYAANGNSLAEFTQGGRIVRLTLPGVEGISPIGVFAR